MRPMKHALALALALASTATAQTLKSETFDRDPAWEGFNNRIVPKSLPTITQDFGYSATHFAGEADGEMGGLVTRASEPAFYADDIGSKTLDDHLTASGTLALKRTTAGGGIFFGFFTAKQPGASGRPIGSLGLDMDCEREGARLAVRLITAQNQSCGTFITPFVPGKFRPTPIRNDGTRYAWKLDYDPSGASGRGRFTFTFRSLGNQSEPLAAKSLPADLPDNHRAEALKRFPNVNEFSVDLPEGYKQQGTRFDHFGLMNMMKAGGQTQIYFDDLEYLGRKQDFSRDPNFSASGNRATYQATDVGGAHNFGFSNTSYAGGKPGEIGGTFWRSDKWGYYADKIAPLSFNERLEARGKVILTVGGPDSDMCFGFFRSPNPDGPAPNRSGDFIGIKVGGPTRVGHYFLPAFTVNDQVRGLPNQGPVMKPGKGYDWSLTYDPKADDGNGALTATLGDESVTLNLKPGQRAKAKDARLDHFGLFSIGPGGQIVKFYLDDLHYTHSKTGAP